MHTNVNSRQTIQQDHVVPHFRDQGPYSSRNTSKGALLNEASRILGQLSGGRSLQEIHREALVGSLLPQKSRNTRRHIWTAINRRYFADTPAWVIDDLSAAAREHPHSPGFVSLLYLHFALRDRLTYDFVTRIVWSGWLQNNLRTTRQEVLSFLDEASKDQPQIRGWSNSSRLKLAGNILTALRDFGVLQGVQRKVITKPDLPLGTAEHLLRILTAQGLKGSQVIRCSDWRLFLRTEEEVAELLRKLGQFGGIRFERGGSTVVLETPTAWSGRQ